MSLRTGANAALRRGGAMALITAEYIEIVYPVPVKYLLIILFLYSSALIAKEFKCGMAEGYAPFQYVVKGKGAGIDMEIVKVFNKIGPHKIIVSTGHWDDLVAELFHTKRIDCLIGMEKSSRREDIFTFSNVVYQRESSIILREDSSISKLTSLKGKLVCGDKDSPVESYLLGLEKISMRVIYMETKEKCMVALRDGLVSAAILPDKVSNFLGPKLGFKTKEILDRDFFSDVGFAFKKSDDIDLTNFNAQLLKLHHSKSFINLLKKKNIKVSR